jgi:CheY-like chemotaxis protein
VKLDISDNGSGISSKIINNIFEPCFTTKPAKEGTGMGLSVVYSIIDNYDGYILVNSEIGKGTKFVIFLPRTYEKNSIVGSSDMHKDITSVQGSGRILVVDDEDMITGMLKVFLEKAGYSVHIENAPVMAIKYFSEHHAEIDCIITDLMMPNMSGVTLTKLLQDIDSTVPIIWCTGHLSFESQINAENLGVVEVIQKPVDGYDIASAIHKQLTT